MEGYAKGIADDLKNKAMGGFACSVQNGVVARPQGFPLIRMLLRKLSAALDIGKKECNGAGRESYTSSYMIDYDISTPFWKYSIQ